MSEHNDDKFPANDEVIRRALNALGDRTPTRGVEAGIQAALDDVYGVQKRRFRTQPYLIAAALSLLAVAVVLLHAPQDTGDARNRMVDRGPAAAGESTPRLEEAQSGATDRSLGTLIRQSARLDAVWSALPKQGRVQRVDTASRISAIEDRVAQIDQRLSASISAVPVDQRQSLWQQRVELMHALVSLRTEPSDTVFL